MCSFFKGHNLFTSILVLFLDKQSSEYEAPEWRENRGKMEMERQKRKCESGRTGVSGILSANGLIYHHPRCYGNQHSGQITGCWSGVFLLFPFFFFLRPVGVCISEGRSGESVALISNLVKHLVASKSSFYYDK